MASSPGSPSTTLNSDAWSWGLENQVHGPEPAAQIPQSGVREAEPFRPLPRSLGPTSADPPGDRGTRPETSSYRTGRRERRLPADACNQGSRRQEAVRPVDVRIELPQGARLVSGEREVELGHLAGRSTLAGNKWKSPVFFEGLPSDYARRTVWVVRGEGTVEVEVRGGRAGSARLETK